MPTAPYGSWKSPITSDLIVKGTIGLSQPRIADDHIYWVELRPSERGRQVIVRRSPEGETLQTFATLTTEANPALALIQDRMPVIIERTDWPLWLREEDGNVTALLRPLPADRLRIWPIERTVNNVRNDGPELLAPSRLPDEQPILV